MGLAVGLLHLVIGIAVRLRNQRHQEPLRIGDNAGFVLLRARHLPERGHCLGYGTDGRQVHLHQLDALEGHGLRFRMQRTLAFEQFIDALLQLDAMNIEELVHASGGYKGTHVVPDAVLDDPLRVP